MRNERRNSIGYGFSIMGMLFLVAAAFFMPRLVLGIQDKKYMDETYFDSRSGLDYAAVNTNYEIDLHQRLFDFAQGYQQGRRYFAVASEHTMEVPEINWKQLIGENIFLFLFDIYGIDYILKVSDNLHIMESEFYAIYDEEAVHGAVLMCWQFKLCVGEDLEVKVIMDAKDKTIYNIEFNYGMSTAMIKNIERKDASMIYLYDNTWYFLLSVADYYNSDEDDNTFAVIPSENSYSATITYEGNPLTLKMDYLMRDNQNGRVSVGINEIVQLIPAME